MPKGLTFFKGLLTVAILSSAVPAFAETQASTVVARVNGEAITVGHMIVARASLPAQYQNLPDDVLFNALLDQLVQQTLLKQQLHGEVPDHIQLTVDNESRSLLASEVIQKIMETAQSDDDIREAYDARYADVDGGYEYNASHILVETEDAADDIKTQLDDGVDFAVLAKESSVGPSGPSGGSLGWFGTGRMVKEFEDAVVALKPGEISNPVKTQFGWHVIKLNERRHTEAPDLEEVREQIAQELATQAVEDRVNQLTAAADIQRPDLSELDPSVLRDLSLIK